MKGCVKALVAVMALVLSAACEVPHPRAAAPAPSVAGESRCFDPEMTPLRTDLEPLGLKLLWLQNMGQISRGKAVQAAYLAGGSFLVETRDSTLLHFNAQTGEWTASSILSRPLLTSPVAGVDENGRPALFAPSSLSIALLNPRTGALLKEIPPPFASSCPPVPLSASLIVAGGGGAVGRLNIINSLLSWQVSANGAVLHSPLVDEGAVYAAGLKGWVVAAAQDSGRLLWKWEAGRGMELSSGLAKDESDRLYVGDELGNVYCLTAQDGLLLWRFPVAGPVEHTPVPLGTRLLVFAFRTPATCLDVSSADPSVLWTHADAALLLARGRADRLYVLTHDRSIACISANDGRELWRRPLAEGARVVSDPAEAAFYVYNDSGAIAAFAELE